MLMSRSGRGAIILKGFRFGLLLQFSIGPMCLLVFNTASTKDFFSAISLVLAISLVDLIYIIFALLGITALLNNEIVKKVLVVVGSFVLFIFGLDIMLSVFDKAILPVIDILSQVKLQSFFWQGIILTASNPLTILFWAGVLTTKLASEDLSKKQLVGYGLGCVLSTIIFLSLVTIIGYYIGIFFSTEIIKLLTLFVGAFVCFFGIKMFCKQI